MNAGLIGQAISTHPVFRLAPGDIGHAGVASALTAFREAWSGEFRLRGQAADDAGRLLQGAAGDTERVDALLAEAAAGLGGDR
ncbi:hypothetical protein [Agromyces laixinhei]|uniref:hypothetical protein n=1 Tax=Agromyces laixinhei TaxID=2585717 RepID=UPI0012EE1C38|nr:hypothetical protein [Agromyces laixinhei]